MTSPVAPLDLGNSGTGVRLLMGVVAGQKSLQPFAVMPHKRSANGAYYKPSRQNGC